VAAGLFEDEQFNWYSSLSADGERVEPPSVSDIIDEQLRHKSCTMERVSRTGEIREYDGDQPPEQLLFPLRADGETLGVLFLEIGSSQPPFREKEAALVRHAAMEAGGGIGRLRCSRRGARRSHQTSQLDVARRVQMSLFPRGLDVDPRVEIAAVNQPCIEVGGDYYDVRKTGEDEVTFVVADVTGHGLPAAMLMSNFQGVFRGAIQSEHDVRTIHGELERHVEENWPPDKSVTGILGQLDLAAGRLRLCIAGHPPPVRIRNRHPLSISRNFRTCPWGIHLEKEFRLFEKQLSGPEDLFLFYTDGATEARNAAGEQLRLRGLLDAVGETSFAALQDGVEQLSHQISVWCHQSLQDDFTLLALRLQG
jgi:serine phosphatase RsbU (regulator of sigma subunit)